ncbi:MAG: site-specific integrase [Pyrinomonadaceae bacterium]|nr:site-specific integrase [Pyrinomonadaceae bacterium]
MNRKEGRRDEGSIFRHSDGKRWVARLRYTDQNGKPCEKKRTCETYEKAKIKIRELKGEIERELSDRKTFRELDRFFRANYVHEAKFVGGKKVSGFRQSLDTIENYLDAAVEFFGDQWIDEITFPDLQRYKAVIESRKTQHGKIRSVSDTNHFLKRLRRLFTVAVEQGWLDKNPFNRGSRLIVESHETERTRVLTPAEEEKLLANCDRWRQHLIPLIIFAVETALRRGEIMSLRWSSIDLGRRQLRVESQNSKTLKSRLVPLSSRACDTLADLWKKSNRRQNALVFGSSDFKKGFNTACKEAKLKDVHFHDLRHTAITRWLEKGISPAIAMKASGHSQMKTFLRYVNQSSDSVYEFALKLDKAA